MIIDEFMPYYREEKGIYYGINLRGTNFLIVRAKLGGKTEPVSEIRRQEISIPSEMLANANSSKVLYKTTCLYVRATDSNFNIGSVRK